MAPAYSRVTASVEERPTIRSESSENNNPAASNAETLDADLANHPVVKHLLARLSESEQNHTKLERVVIRQQDVYSALKDSHDTLANGHVALQAIHANLKSDHEKLAVSHVKLHTAAKESSSRLAASHEKLRVAMNGNSAKTASYMNLLNANAAPVARVTQAHSAAIGIHNKAFKQVTDCSRKRAKVYEDRFVAYGKYMVKLIEHSNAQGKEIKELERSREGRDGRPIMIE